MKKLLFLGGAHHQINAIYNAKKKGIYTICFDNLESNPGHIIANESKIISTTHTDKILDYLSTNEIDGIMSYGSDVALPSLAHICEKYQFCGLTNKQAATFSNKNNFRYFLESNNLNSIKFIKLTSDSENTKNQLHKKIIEANLKFPLIIKPADRSGGLGISILNNIDDLHEILRTSFQHSLSNEIIIEEYLESMDYQFCGDGFMKNGKVQFLGIGNNFFNDSTFGPFAEVFPNIIPVNKETIINKIEEIFYKSDYKNGPFNFDIIERENGDYVIIELTPRLGGNFLSEAIEKAFKINLIEENINFSLGNDFLTSPVNLNKSNSYIYNLMLHSKNPNANKITGETNFLGKKPIFINIYKNHTLTFNKDTKMSNFIGNCVFKLDEVEEVLAFTEHLKNNDFII